MIEVAQKVYYNREEKRCKPQEEQMEVMMAVYKGVAQSGSRGKKEEVE